MEGGALMASQTHNLTAAWLDVAALINGLADDTPLVLALETGREPYSVLLHKGPAAPDAAIDSVGSGGVVEISSGRSQLSLASGTGGDGLWCRVGVGATAGKVVTLV